MKITNKYVPISLILPIQITHLLFVEYLVNLEYCLESIRIAQPQPVEILLIDMGSLELFADKIKQLAKKYSCVYTLPRSKNVIWSRSRALNTGIRQATQPYVSMLDADMVVHPKYFQIIYDAAQKPNIFVWSGCASLSKDKIKTANYEELLRQNPVPFGGSSQITIIKEAIERTGLYDEQFEGWGGEDDLMSHVQLPSLGFTSERLELCLIHLWHEHYITIMTSIRDGNNAQKMLKLNRQRYSSMLSEFRTHQKNSKLSIAQKENK